MYKENARLNGLVKFMLRTTLSIFCFLLLCAPSAFGSTVGKEAGAPTGSYPLSDFDTVSLFSGNLNFNLPFLSIGGRGGSGQQMSLNIRREWSEWRYIYQRTYSYSPYSYSPPAPTEQCQVEFYWFEPYGYIYQMTCTQTSTPSQVYISDVTFHNPIPDVSLNPIKPGYGPGILKGKTRAYWTQGCRFFNPATNRYEYQDFGGRPWQTTAFLVFTEPDGTEHQFVDQQSQGSIMTFPVPNCDDPPVSARGTTWVSTEDSSTTFVADTAPPEMMGTMDNFGVESFYGPSGYMLKKDGTRYRIDGGLVSWIRDRNGNRTDFTYDSNKRVKTATDSLGRQVSIDYDVNDTTLSPDGTAYGLSDQIHFNGINGTPRTIRITKNTLTNALRAGYTPQTTSQLWPNLGQYGNNGVQISDQIQIASALWMPDGRAYKFQYNSFGELARVELPTGGAVEYDHDYTINYTDGLGQAYHVLQPGPFLRHVTERREYTDKNNAGSLTKKTTFSNIYPEGYSGGTVTPQPIVVDQKDNNNVLLSRTKHYFIGHPMNINKTQTLVQAPPWDNGLERSTEIIDPSDGLTVLKRIDRTWTPRVLGQGTSETLDPNLTETKTSLLSADQNTTIVSKHTLSYDSFNNVTDTQDYDFGLGAPRAYPVRQTHTDYIATADYTDASGPHLRNLPSAQKVYSINPQNGTQTLVAQTEMKYDETPLDPWYGTVQSWAEPGSVRGNLTKVRRWLDTTGAWLETRKEYDQVGNVSKLYDELNNMSEIKYSADYQRAYPTQTISAVPDPSGVTGSSTAFTTSTAYDFSTGQILQDTDINTQTTSYSYVDDSNVVDALDRLRKVTRPAGGGSTKYEYGDTPGNIFVKASSEIESGVWKEGFTFYDGLGRAFKEQSHDTQSDIFRETIFDGLGRVSKASNPYRPGDQKQWVETVYDGLGRTKQVIYPRVANETTPATTTVDYSVSAYGVVHVATSQAGKKSRSIMNGLDQLVRVDEPNADTNDLGSIDSPVQATSYKYDALGNLRQVVQGSQSRFFLYDSLGRLLRIKEPEQDVNSSLAITDPVTNNGQWTAGFTYDARGSLLTTTDAKGVVTTVSYDNLNRVYQRTYSIPQTSDPKRITVATSTVSFKYDGLLSPSPNDPNPGVVAFGRGVITEVSNSGSMTQLTSFDAVGHILGSRQITDGQVYPFAYQYNLAGALKSEVYPSGRMVTTGIDDNGDLSSVSSNLPNHPSVTYASDFRYLANGTADQFRLGNGRWETYQTNARQQITQIALGTSASDTSLWKVQYEYGKLNQDGSVDVSQNDGNVAKQTITVPGITAAFVQTYKYDSLNRLQEAVETSGATQNWKQTYQYDRYGNRTGFTYNINGSPVSLNSTNNPAIDSSNNRISAGQGYDYDFNGNIIQDSLGRKFVFDADNRQRTLTDSANQTIATYDYDGSGRRIKKTNAAGQQTVFVYDATNKLVAEYSSETTSTSGRSYITNDLLNSPRVISNNDGNVTSRRDFMPFGESIAVARSVNQNYGVDDGLRKNFTSKERDNESGLDFFEARYYASMHGRFTSPDPLLASARVAEPQSWNRYNYCSNNPLNIVDPKGLDWWYLKDSDRPSPVWFDRDPGTKYRRWTDTYDYVYYDNTARKFAVLNPGANNYFVADTLEHANQLFDTYYGGGTVGSQAEGEFLGGLGAGVSPAGIILDQLNAAVGMDITSRDYKTGQVLGAGLGGGLALFSSAALEASIISKPETELIQLNKQLASEAQMSELMAGQGKPIAGAGTSTVLRDAPRLVAEHGGIASDWAKVRSFSYEAADGVKWEIHAYQNTVTGKIVEFKTKFAGP